MQYDLHNGYALFRKEFELRAVPKKALFHLTADQSYQLYVNGTYVCRGPARGYQKHWPFDTVDLGPYLRQGANLIAVRAHNPGCSTFQYVHQGMAGFLAAADWGKFKLVTDRTWKSRRQAGIRRDTVTSSLQLFHQEEIDLRVEDPSWMLPEFDDSSWSAPFLSRAWNSMPWFSLEPRGIPMLEETIVTPSHVLGQASGRSSQEWATIRNLAALARIEKLPHQPLNAPGHEITIPATKRGQWRSVLIDFGNPVVGSLMLEIDGASGGEVIDTFHAELIDQSSLAQYASDLTHCRTSLASRLTCRPGSTNHAFYHPYGFRYVMIKVRDSQQPLTLRVRLRTAFYPMERHGVFQSSDPVLEKIWECCAWTQRICSMDAFVDTPWREQAQWWGDARVQAKNTAFYSGDTRLFRRGLAQIAAQTTPDGLTYGHAPTAAHDCILPDFTLIWMITLWDYYWQTGSTEPFLTHQETLTKALAYFADRTDPKTGLIGYDQRHWLFLDWTPILKEGYSTLYNLWLLMALEKMAKLHDLTGQAGQAKSLKAWARRLRQSLLRLVRPDGLMEDGLTLSSKRVRSTAVHTQTLAILAGFQPEHSSHRVEKVLLPFLNGKWKSKVIPSSYWITYVFDVCSAQGHGELVVERIRKLWQPALAQGSTVEQFLFTPGDTSHSQAWAAHPLSHLMEILGGVRQTAPGWREISFSPVFHGTHAEVSIPTPHGLIQSAWRRQDDIIDVTLELPIGIAAKTRLPGMAGKMVTGRHHWNVLTDSAS